VGARTVGLRFLGHVIVAEYKVVTVLELSGSRVSRI
jgi:hypothetical protein